MPTLAFISSNAADQYCELEYGKYSVGRSRKNRIVIRDKSVSGEHCEILVSGAEVIVRERGSRNGVFVEGERVRAQKGVRHGETIRFGRIEARLDLSGALNEAPTAISAMDELRHFEAEQSPSSEEGPAPQTSFLIEPNSGTPSNQTAEVAPPATIEETKHSLTTKIPNQDSSVEASQSSNRWIYAGLGLGLVIVMGWILSKL